MNDHDALIERARASRAVAIEMREQARQERDRAALASDYQIVRVTIGNSQLPAPTADRNPTSFVVQFDRPIDPVTIAPGESFTYTLDPREVGAAVDPRPGLRHVRVSFRFKVEVLEGQSAPRPTLTIEVLNRRTGALESFVAFPGFAGGVVVAAGD